MAVYFLDTEFNGYKGQLVSVGLVKEDGTAFYAVLPAPPEKLIDPWVRANVIPIINAVPQGIPSRHLSVAALQDALQEYLQGEKEEEIRIVADWPDDVKYFSDLLITGPGKMINIPGIVFEVKRVDAYPSSLVGAVQHNAIWDALALRFHLTGESNWCAFKPALPT